jgi:hypothetical protein
MAERLGRDACAFGDEEDGAIHGFCGILEGPRWLGAIDISLGILIAKYFYRVETSAER